MKNASLSVVACVSALLILNYTQQGIAESACPGVQASAPTNVGHASIIVTLGKFKGTEPPNAAEAPDAAKPRSVTIRVQEDADAEYDGTDVYNSAPSGSCSVAVSGYPPSVPLIAGPSSGDAGVLSAGDLRFVLLAEEPGNESSTLPRITLRFYKNVGGVPSVAPFYITDIPTNNCSLVTGYYVFSLSQAQVNALDPEITAANESKPSCATNIYVGGSLSVDRDSATPPSTVGEIFYVGNVIASPCSFSITPSTTQTFDASGGTGAVNVSYPAANTGCLWTSAAADSWITITSGKYGSKGVTVKYSVGVNDTGGTRSTTLTIAGQSLTITQSCVSISPPKSQVFGADGGSANIFCSTQGAGCTLIVNNSNPWITVNSASGGTINYTVGANNTAGSAARTGTIGISGFNYLVKQAGTGGNCGSTPIAPGQSIGGALSTGDCPSTVDNSNLADRYSFTGTAGQHVSFSIAGTSNARFNVIDPNERVIASNAGPPMFLDLPIDGTYSLEVMQATGFFSYTLSMCSFTFAPSALYATHVGGTGTINVTEQGGCSWQAFSNGWLQITSGNNYTGSAIVSYTVDASFDHDRRVNAIIATGKAFLITQLGIPFYYSDFDRDRKTDVAVYRPSNTTWYVLNSTTGVLTTPQLGAAGDVLVPGDYDGDGRTDIAVWRPSEGNWYIVNSSIGSSRMIQWGVSGDIPVPADYDGDGITDIAIWRPSNGVWYVINSSTGLVSTTAWGVNGDKPVPADYDADGRVDIAAWRPSNGTWYIINSFNGSVSVYGWGVSTDRVAPADYDGDGKADIVAWRPSTGVWFIINSSSSSVSVIGWGVSTDKPVSGDFDGDGKADIAVYRPNTGGNSFWYIINSSDGSVRVVQFGDLTDTPVPSVYVR